MSLNWGEVRRFAASCPTVGVEPPASIVKALNVLEVAQATVADPVASALLGMSDGQIREHVEALSIRQHRGMHGVGDRGLRIGVELLDAQLAVEVRAVVAGELDKLIEKLQPEFTEFAAPLERAAREFGFEAQTSSDDILERPDFAKAGAAWRQMKSSWFRLAPIVKWRIAACRTFGFSPSPEETRRAGHLLIGESNLNYSVCFLAGDGWSLDPDALRVGRDRQGHTDWLSLARQGLRLNTISEVSAKLDDRRIERVAPSFPDPGMGEFDAIEYRYPVERRKQ